jgi:23S rRNA (cytosine1962-C5)-methyltransferase
MHVTGDYELLDFGQGRKLERFGPIVLDRPSPSADQASRQLPERWRQAAAQFQGAAGQAGDWRINSPPSDDWRHVHGRFSLKLRLTEFGHVGLFPEQAENWDWIAGQLAPRTQPANVLNLFAYTGGSTLAAAATGARVTHVDASRSTVAWARRNADVSGLGEAPIRWIIDDARKFVTREIKRGRRYDAVVLDPPSFGHGGGQTWKLTTDLDPLLADCARLTGPEPAFMLLTCHTPGFDPATLASCWSRHFPQREIEASDLYLSTLDGRRLHSGTMARFGTRS